MGKGVGLDLLPLCYPWLLGNGDRSLTLTPERFTSFLSIRSLDRLFRRISRIF
jgi:hypothetical protein